MTYEEKRKLVETRGIMLDGKPAAISGAMLRWATVSQLPEGLSYQWAWETVKHIVARDGKFEL